MTLIERLADANQRSVKLYLQRTQIEEQKQMLQAQGQQLVGQGMAIDRELLKLDGEIDLLTKMIAEDAKASA